MQNLWINGQWERGKGPQLSSLNPATGETVWQGHEASHDQVDKAIKSARDSFESWMLLAFEDRVKIVKNFEEQLKSNQTLLAETLAKDVGKPLWEAATEVKAMIGKVDISIDAYQARTGTSAKTLNAHQTAVTRHKPHGVFVVLGPYNFPGHIPNGHILPAILAGNTIVFKPSELTPLTADVVMRCWQAAGIPDGVINMIQGGSSVGQKLISSQLINGVLFTGSYQTGAKLHKFFSGHPEMLLALEMGGNNPLVVMDVKNQQAAAYHTLVSAYITSGQRCTCARRLIVPRGHAGDEFIDLVEKMTRQLKVGPYTQTPEPFMGPVISKQAAQHLLAAQEDLIKRGANAIIPMEHLIPQTGFVTPALIDVTPMKERYDLELFGPLLQLIRVENFEEAIVEANKTNYGLSAGLLSDDPKLFEQFYRGIHAGIVNWNQPLTGASSAQPFGGIGLSGNFRPSAYYAADYCAYPVASLENESLSLPEEWLPGMV
jgi:succinylglutamic semialdehyde dehydrogenase